MVNEAVSIIDYAQLITDDYKLVYFDILRTEACYI